MARTDPLTAALLLSHHPHPHKHHHGTGKTAKPKVPAQAEFHIGHFHHYITGDQIAIGLGVIIALVVVAVVAAWLRSIFA